jgi:hypothetical protein
VLEIHRERSYRMTLHISRGNYAVLVLGSAAREPLKAWQYRAIR